MKKALLSIALFVACVISCSEDPNDFVEQETITTNDATKITRSFNLNDIITLHNKQSDPIAMIVDFIVQTDSTFILNLTQEDSRLLGIPDSVYEKGLSIVESLNTQHQQ